jgi:hypothetical protein
LPGSVPTVSISIRVAGTLALLAVTVAACGAVPVDPPQADDVDGSQPCSAQVATGVTYASVPGVAADPLALDVYPAPGACEDAPSPVVV